MKIGESDNKELMLLFGDLDILLFVRISWLNWVGHVNRMDSKKKKHVSVFVCKQKLIHSKVQIRKGGKKTELVVRSPLRRRRSALDCCAI